MGKCSLVLGIAFFCLVSVGMVKAKSVLRRENKISEDFKRLQLAPEEIDPNVAPDPVHISEQHVPADTLENGEDIDVSANEVDSVVDPVDVVSSITATPAFAPATPAATVATVATAANASSSTSASNSASTSTSNSSATAAVHNEDDPSGLSKYCKCTDSHCDCCRDISVPFTPIRGPGCAKLSYLGDEKMSLSIKYGDLTLATRTISSKRARPLCVSLPGGYSKFCGRIYGLTRSKENFKACLGFELRADDDVEAALRVSCFKFGPKGVKVAEAEPFPAQLTKGEEDDEDDIFGFGGGGDDYEGEDDYDEEDDEEEDDDAEAEADDDDDDDDDAAAEAPADVDYGGFSLAGLLDELDEDEDEVRPAKGSNTNPATATVIPARTVQSKNSKVSATDSAAGSEITTVRPDGVPSGAVKAKRSKKAKKNKKEKAADLDETDFAYELFNGLLDFFN